MLGASIYLSQDLRSNLCYIERLAEHHVKYVFTSMHVAEEDPIKTRHTISILAQKIDTLGMNLIVDISTDTLRLHQVNLQDMNLFFKSLGLRYLRVDYGFTLADIKEMKRDFEIVLNASTIDEAYCEEAKKMGIDLANVLVCHNFYPRKDTALDVDFYFKRNQVLKQLGFRIMAFIPGNQKLRGPVFEGLPTLEVHRSQIALCNYIELKDQLLTDIVMIGDIELDEQSVQEIETYMQEGVITLRCTGAEQVLNQIQTNRSDVARNVIRSVESRTIAKQGYVQSGNCEERPIGTITVDNEGYLRYMGELQITKVNLGQDSRVNVIGHVLPEYHCLLPLIQSSQKFKLVK